MKARRAVGVIPPPALGVYLPPLTLTALTAAIALAPTRLRVAARLLLLLALTVLVPVVTGLARLTLPTLLSLLLRGAHVVVTPFFAGALAPGLPGRV